MKFVIDDKIPYIKGILEAFAEVKYLPGSKIGPGDISDADALIIRTRTKCDKHLLEGSAVKFIATATIGYDHIDTEYCRMAGIEWANAPGCNSESVNQYVASALTHWSASKNIPLEGKTIGIIGVGNVGSKVAQTAGILGMRVLLNDPPRARKEGSKEFVDLRMILREADIISLHVPLNPTGIDKTFHMANACFFESWKNPQLFINTCRGEVMDTTIVRNKLQEKKLADCIIDCWENEPEIDIEFLNMCTIATPHIAGYSRDGKANGTAQAVAAANRYFKLGMNDWFPEKIESPHFPEIIIDGQGLGQEKVMKIAIQSTYAIDYDDKNLRDAPENFEKLRGDYPIRREFHAFTIHGRNVDDNTTEKLKKLGFKIK